MSSCCSPAACVFSREPCSRVCWCACEVGRWWSRRCRGLNDRHTHSGEPSIESTDPSHRSIECQAGASCESLPWKSQRSTKSRRLLRLPSKPTQHTTKKPSEPRPRNPPRSRHRLARNEAHSLKKGGGGFVVAFYPSTHTLVPKRAAKRTRIDTRNAFRSIRSTRRCRLLPGAAPALPRSLA